MTKISNRNNYNTDQKNALIQCFTQNPDRQMSVKDITDFLQNQNIKIALATIYRQLDSLEQNGVIKKFVSENGKKSCWQFVNGNKNCSHHYHLKCENCGKIEHLECDFVSQIDAHILNEHGFNMDKSKTVFYGICKTCSKKTQNI